MIARVQLANDEIEEFDVDPRTRTTTSHREGYWHFRMRSPSKKTVAISEDEVVRVDIDELVVPDDASTI